MADFQALLLASGALVEGHFVYNSMRHGRRYVNKTAGLVLASHAQAYGYAIAQQFVSHGIEAVVAPELGAIPLMTRVQDCLHDVMNREVFGIMATKIVGTEPAQFEIGRDQARFLDGRRVLVIEDVLTEGNSAASTIAAVKAAGGIVIGAGVLWNRGGVTKETIGAPHLFCCVDEEIESFDPADCPLCKQGIPVRTDLGKGNNFLLEKQARAP